MSTVELYWRARRGGALGLTGVEQVGMDWSAIISRKDRVVESWSKGTKASLEKSGIAVVEGRAAFVGSQELRVGERKLTAGRFIIATGSSPTRPLLERADRAITSDELLDLKTRPKRLVVLGGGYIGMELGFCLARAGSAVTVLQRGPHMLPGIDDELRDALLDLGREGGMKFHCNVNVKRVREDRTVDAEVNGTAEVFPADVVLLATGRLPNVQNLGLDKVGIELSRGGVKVNDYLQSASLPHVYAAGDVIGHHLHTPAAWYEGQIAAHNALKGNERKVDFSVFPTAVFTIPAIGQVGLTEAEARNQGLRVSVKRMPLKHNPAAGVREETEGLVKVVYKEDTDHLLGIHILGAHAEDLIQIASVALRAGLKRAEISAMHYVFPTLGGAVFDAMAS